MARLSVRHISMMVVAALLLAGLAVAVLRYVRVGRRPDVSGYAVRGIDVSAHNGAIDFGRVAADSIAFVYIKATEGARFRDSAFDTNYAGARAAGLKVGAYHFYRFDRPGAVQADNLLGALRGKVLDMPLVIDVEEWTNPDDVADHRVVSGVNEMISRISERGYRVMLYSNKKDFYRYVRRVSGDLPLWICSFVEPEGTLDWTMWQFTHAGEVDGVAEKVDINVFVGNDSTWQDFVNQSHRVIE